MTESEKLIQALKAKQPRRVMVYMEVQIAGQWVWELLPAGQDTPQSAMVTPGLPIPKPIPTPTERPKYQGSSRPAAPKPTPKPLTFGRDPAEFLFTFGKFKGQTIGQVNDVYALNSWAEWANEQEDPTVSLEVAREQVEAFLIEREFVPSPKKRRA